MWARITFEKPIETILTNTGRTSFGRVDQVTGEGTIRDELNRDNSTSNLIGTSSGS